MNWSTAQLTEVYRRRGEPAPIAAACGDGKRQKYNVSPKEDRTVDGIVFDSKREAHHYLALKIAERAGVIYCLKLQPRFLLQPPWKLPTGKTQKRISYVADFQFIRTDPTGALEEIVVVDVKGVETEAYRIKAKIFRAKYPEMVLEVWK
jgi:hypothetical protein